MTNLLTEKYSEMQLPEFKKEWTIGTILSATLSAISLGSVIFGIGVFISKLDDATKGIPQIVKTQQESAKVQQQQSIAIAVLQDQQRYADLRYAEIMNQLTIINAKLDKQNEERAIKTHR